MTENHVVLMFKRIEVKYLLSLEQYAELKKRIMPYVTKDTFGEYTIANVYFDNDNFHLVSRSLEHPLYKEKLRMRSYGVPNDNSYVFFEIKKKYDDVVYKRRIRIQYRTLMDYLNKGIVPIEFKDDSSFKEIQCLMKEYSLVPKVYLAYDREAYFTNENQNFRITFDSNIRYRFYDPTLTQGDYGEKLLASGYRVLELKTDNVIPLWLVKILNELKIYHTSFTKYGKAYEKYRENNAFLKKEIGHVEYNYRY